MIVDGNVFECEHGMIIFGDALDILPKLEKGSVDMVLTDLPYGTTYAPWDSIIPLTKMWEGLLACSKDDSALVFTASQPFTTTLIGSKIDLFRCEWIWNKENAANFANAKKQPLKQHESVVVFSKKASRYYPQKVQGKKNHIQGKSKTNRSEGRLINERVEDDLSGLKYPKSILNFPKHSSQCSLHVNQKPVELFEYMMKTYSVEGDLILDIAAGSSTTAEAAIKTGRKFICIENDEGHFNTSVNRIKNLLEK